MKRWLLTATHFQYDAIICVKDIVTTPPLPPLLHVFLP